MAKLYFTYSAMNAGKSTILLQSAHNYRERGMKVTLWTSPHVAADPDGVAMISSRIGLCAEARMFESQIDLFAATQAVHVETPLDAVLLDEAQFLTRAQVWQLSRVADALSIPVLCFGLRTDFRGKLFEGAAELLGIADSLREIRTICHCGAKATMVIRLDESGNAAREGDTVGVERDTYASLCRRHWVEATSC